MLTINHLQLSIQRVSILRNISFQLDMGKTYGLIGRNGAGKTTLMRALMGLLPISDGSIVFNEQPLHKARSHQRISQGIGYLPEDRRLVPHFTVEENILVPLWANSRHDPQRLQWAYDLMPEIARYANRKALTLSGGQQKLVALARAMVAGSNLLLLDEPFEGVAPALAQRLMEVILNLRSESLTVLISESNFGHIENCVDQVYSIERGQLSASAE